MNFPEKDFLLCAFVNVLIPEHKNGQSLTFSFFSPGFLFFELDFFLTELK